MAGWDPGELEPSDLIKKKKKKEKGKGKGRKRECRAVSENWVDHVLSDMSWRWVGRFHHHRCFFGEVSTHHRMFHK